ncbi:patatin-like phospholipase family protein [Solirubrobacter ginsenosidimutans]|uniref:Patatin-like phospholipase family protein n=1 Tax=Solirubrobacter ginsenosidimutans TaxID=490573 RepID=A0A9X3S4E2_9ACTN|nr:patatin-like phospholipase family protein [Solirubrobacter ginsenosidimutans]MDA0165704.1 patatin-like phospholipase family protein [Solirubrobacter ginsenosidimutans]
MIAVVLAGGGERVVAWEIGVLAGLVDGGIDPRRAAAVLGTSAGALVAARVAAGVDPRADADAIAAAPPGRHGSQVETFVALAAAWESAGASTAERRRAFGRLAVEQSPGGEEAAVASVARRLPGGGWPASLRVAAVDARSGERVVFDPSAGVSLARAIAASRAVPVLRAPVTIGGRPLIDGALGSATNADALAGIDAWLTIIITPVAADPAATGPERLWLTALREEVAGLERHGRNVVVVHASIEEREAMGPDPMSAATAPLAMAAGRERGRAVAGQISPRRAA